MQISKKQVTAQLKEVAKLLDVLGEEPFKARAYTNAVRQIENYAGDFSELLLNDQLTQLKGIGAGLASELAHLKENDIIPSLVDLYERVPLGVRELFLVSGLGAKKVSALWQSDITSLEELIMAADDGRIEALKGFSSKSATKFKASAEFVIKSKNRMRLDEAEVLTEYFIALINQEFKKDVAFAAGSYRRKLETIGDIDLIIKTVDVDELLGFLQNYLEIDKVEENRIFANFQGRELSFLCIAEEFFGWVWLLETGNSEYREMLLARAQAKGYQVKDWQFTKNARPVKTFSEKDALQLLDLEFIIPERRESANPKPASNIVSLKDIHGLVHNHSTWSDAAATIAEMIVAAQERGFSYLAMADHSKTSYYANGLSIERVYAQAKEIAQLRAELQEQGSDFGLLHGIEVDIMTDGSLDYPDEVLASLDYTVVSVHQNFTLSKVKQTERIIKAISNPYASILGHLSGRLLLRRPPYELDQDAIIEACAQTGTVIEINAHPARLDMDWRYVIKAKEKGCKFSINPDAHETSGFDVLKYGLMMARKAGLSSDDIVNTAPSAQEFLARLKQFPFKP